MSTCRPAMALAPGKLVLAGDYAVLEPGEPALVLAVDRELAARVTPAADHRFSSTSLALHEVPATVTGTTWSVQGPPAPRTHFTARAVEAALSYLQARGLAPEPFHLALEGTLENPLGQKYGFGSSAATCVAVVGAVLGAFDVVPDAATVFKLAAWAHHKVQGRGSGIDVAAATYGGVLRYVAFDRAWLDRQPDPAAAAAQDWPWLGLEPLSLARPPVLAVGWTGQPASTVPLIRAAEAVSARKDPGYARFLIESREATHGLARALSAADVPEALRGIRRARAALAVLQELMHQPIETPALRRLAEIAAACGGEGKLSGAGGGDCGLALFPTQEAAATARERWRAAEIEPLEVALAPLGLRVSR